MIFDKQQPLFLKEEYDRDNRLYTKRELGKFRIMRSDVLIDNFGVRITHPPSFLFETELVYKINMKHDNSVYNSDLVYHERSEDNLFPLNKLQKFRLIDVTTEIVNPPIHPKQNILGNNKKRNHKCMSTDFNASNPNRKPPLKHFNISSTMEQPLSQGKEQSTEKLFKKEIRSSVEKNKSELVHLLEKSNFVIETTNPSKLNYFYKKGVIIDKDPLTSKICSAASSGSDLNPISGKNCSINNLKCMKRSNQKPCSDKLKVNLFNNLHSPTLSSQKVTCYYDSKCSNLDQQLFSANTLPSKY